MKKGLLAALAGFLTLAMAQKFSVEAGAGFYGGFGGQLAVVAEDLAGNRSTNSAVFTVISADSGPPVIVAIGLTNLMVIPLGPSGLPVAMTASAARAAFSETPRRRLSCRAWVTMDLP